MVGVGVPLFTCHISNNIGFAVGEPVICSLLVLTNGNPTLYFIIALPAVN
jgi:hypothetical protein